MEPAQCGSEAVLLRGPSQHVYTVGLLVAMRWLRFVGSFKLLVSSAKDPYKRDDILRKRPVISRSLLIVAIP